MLMFLERLVVDYSHLFDRFLQCSLSHSDLSRHNCLEETDLQLHIFFIPFRPQLLLNMCVLGRFFQLGFDSFQFL